GGQAFGHARRGSARGAAPVRGFGRQGPGRGDSGGGGAQSRRQFDRAVIRSRRHLGSAADREYQRQLRAGRCPCRAAANRRSDRALLRPSRRQRGLMAAEAEWLRSYRSVFAARFMLMLQYRAAAVAGFVTQCWWGIIKVMGLAAFYHGAAARQPLSFPQTVAYVWLGQAFLMLMPWWGDPEITEMVRSGNVSYERLRPLDTYFFWYARALAWITARMAPRAAMMIAFVALLVPLVGLGQWGLAPPPSPRAAARFVAGACCSGLPS